MFCFAKGVSVEGNTMFRDQNTASGRLDHTHHETQNHF